MAHKTSCTSRGKPHTYGRHPRLGVDANRRARIRSRTRSVTASVGTWHERDLSEARSAPIDQCAELAGVALATIDLAANVETSGRNEVQAGGRICRSSCTAGWCEATY
jgi:hypothetical protein